VGRTSDWIDPDSPDAALASSSCAALQQQLSWAAFLGLQAVLLPQPRQLSSPFNYVQVVNQVREMTAPTRRGGGYMCDRGRGGGGQGGLVVLLMLPPPRQLSSPFNYVQAVNQVRSSKQK